MEAFEAGVITSKETGGLHMRFGDSEAIVPLTETIGKREGFGGGLAEGSERAAQRLGRGAKFLITRKGQLYGPEEIVKKVQAVTGWDIDQRIFGGGRAPFEYDACLQCP